MTNIADKKTHFLICGPVIRDIYHISCLVIKFNSTIIRIYPYMSFVKFAKKIMAKQNFQRTLPDENMVSTLFKIVL